MLVAHTVALLALFGYQLCSAIDITTEYGVVRGQVIPVVLETGDFNVNTFWGIHFARAPVGDLRFEVSLLIIKLL